MLFPHTTLYRAPSTRVAALRVYRRSIARSGIVLLLLSLVATLTLSAASEDLFYVVDDSEGGTYSEGQWSTLELDSDHGGTAVLARDRVGPRFVFHPEIDEGHYRVYLWWPEVERLSPKVRVDIRTLSEKTTVNVDQSQNSARWNLIGEFDLTRQSNLSLHASDLGSVAVDAILFERVPRHETGLAVAACFKTDAEVETETESEPEPERESEPDSNSESDLDSETDADSESEPDPDASAETEED